MDCSVANMAERDKSASIEQLLVDTGSEYTWLPSQVLQAIGVQIEKPNLEFVMANGEVIGRDVGYALLKVNGFETVDEVVFAEGGDLNLLAHELLRVSERLSMRAESNCWLPARDWPPSHF